MKSFLKYPGGKSSIAGDIIQFFPKKMKRYIELFVGGGSVYFYLQSTPKRVEKAILNDHNSKLMDCYRAIQKDPKSVYEILLDLDKPKRSKDYYHQLRDRYNKEIMSLFESAALFLWLNRRCFNGLVRFNSKGLFNSSYGGDQRKDSLPDLETLLEYQKLLAGVELYSEDFEYFSKIIAPGDVIYLDPPYMPLSKTSNFTGYYKSFLEVEHRRLKDFIDKHRHIASFILSNSHTEAVEEIFGAYRSITLETFRSIAGAGDKRKNEKEYILLP